MSDTNKNILLSGQESDVNNIGFLTWTPYEGWFNSIDKYSIQVRTYDNNFSSTANISPNTDLTFTDLNFFPPNFRYNSDKVEKCYRIAASKVDGTAISYSNTVCIPYEHLMFIPTAFSPNGDGINDIYRVTGIELEKLTITVYNRWGEKVSQGENWDGLVNGLPAPLGVYSVITRALSRNGWINQTSALTLIR
jgi:gliding motility-associated-like protein